MARMAIALYALAIMIAGVAPHCDWMFPVAKAAPHAGQAHVHGAHGDHHAPAKTPERDCAAMEMAKSIGPVPAVLTLAQPDLVAVPVILPEPQALPAPIVVTAAQPRAPPRTSGGFAAVFASNHRLLI